MSDWSLRDGHPHHERVGPTSVIAEPEPGKGTWQIGVVCLRMPTLVVLMEGGLTEEEAKQRGRKLEMAFAAVASWAARESDTETTRRETAEAMEARIERAGGKREVVRG